MRVINLCEFKSDKLEAWQIVLSCVHEVRIAGEIQEHSDLPRNEYPASG